ncbi:bleomycin resistance family protein [bacterium]|nr:bleomycin resistance family protein [bacterium]MBU1957236.1 bleomycin resistance family protein [bacterium]
MQMLTPNLAVKNIKESVVYYQNLGFEFQVAVAEDKSFGATFEEDKHYIWAMLKRGNVEIMLQEKESLQKDIGTFFNEIGASCTFYIAIEDVNSFYDGIKGRVEIYKDIETTWYGQREFYIRDINGYILGFSSKDGEFAGA